MPPGDLFPTADEAARDALGFVNSRSIRENVEYGGKVVATPAGGFRAETPRSLGRGDALRLSFERTLDAMTVGDYHTHGDYSRYDRQGNLVRTDASGDALGSDEFSLADKLGAARTAAFLRNPAYVIYLATPGGLLKRFSPATGETLVLPSPLVRER